MVGVLIRREERHTQGEGHVVTEAEIECCIYRPRTTTDFQLSAEARGEVWDRFFLTAHRKKTTLLTP